jgi:hypothetical protein
MYTRIRKSDQLDGERIRRDRDRTWRARAVLIDICRIDERRSADGKELACCTHGVATF